MKTPTIIAYLKPTCGWSMGVRGVLQKYQLPYGMTATSSTIPTTTLR